MNEQKRATWQVVAAMVIFCITAIGFVAIAKEVRDNETTALDTEILLNIHQLHAAWLDRAMLWITNSGGPVAVPLLTAAISLRLWFINKRTQALKLFLGVAGASVINLVLKVLFARQRPALWDRLVTEQSFSFPSGHAMASSALAAAIVLALWHTKWRIPAIIAGSLYTLLIGFSRMYLGVHYPTDIAAGWLVSVAWVILVAFIFRRAARATHTSATTTTVKET